MDFTPGFIRTYFKASLNKPKVKELKFKIRGNNLIFRIISLWNQFCEIIFAEKIFQINISV
jgi:hypothetical protein